MHFSPSHPAHLRRRLAGAAISLPLLAAGVVVTPASAAPSPEADGGGITVEGRYNTAGAGCHSPDNAEGCLSWGVRVPSTIAPNESTTVTIEADSSPGQWTWSCSPQDGDKVAGTSAFYVKARQDEPATKLADSGLSFFNHLYYTQHGDSAGSVKAVSCTPEHLSLTYEVDFQAARDQSSYLDLDIGATTVAPGGNARSYSFNPTIRTSTGSLTLFPTATAQKPADSAIHATVTTEEVKVDGANKDSGRFTMKARNDSTSPLSDFTVSVGRSKGQAQVTALTCDLSAFGGEIVTAKGPADTLKASSGKATVPSGKEVVCQADLSGIVGRNTITAGITTGDQTFSADYVDDRPQGEVSVQNSQDSIEAAATGTYEVEVEYAVTFTNRTDAAGRSSDIVLRPQVPAGVTLKDVWGTGLPWWIDLDAYAIQPDGSVSLSTQNVLPAGASTTMTFWNTYTLSADSVSEEGWKALSTCDPKDPSKGLTTLVDIADNGADIEAGTYSTCTAVMRVRDN